ncbi:hypothetical protein BASA61_002889 [Batrachochytrium salamandrivorans]|nr:hypothetical protein BASA61_002889 [Batrachochytrium salamandrivorans]
MQPYLPCARDAIIAADVNHYRVPTSARSTRDLPSVASALGPPTPAQMTFRFHLNVSSDSAPVSYDEYLYSILSRFITTKGSHTLVNINSLSLDKAIQPWSDVSTTNVAV